MVAPNRLYVCLVAVLAAVPALFADEGDLEVWTGQVHGSYETTTAPASGRQGGKSPLLVTLHTADGSIYELDAAQAGPLKLQPGSLVELWGVLQPPEGAASLPVIVVAGFKELRAPPAVRGSAAATAAAQQLGSSNSGDGSGNEKGAAMRSDDGGPRPVSTTALSVLVVLMDFCDDKEGFAATQEDVYKAFFGGRQADGSSIAGHYKYCANGLDVLDPSRFQVVNLAVPCAADNPNVNTRGCRVADTYSWAAYAAEALPRQMGPAFDQYRHVVLVTPVGFKNNVPDEACRGFVARAEVGAYATHADGSYGFGIVFVSGDRFDAPNVYMHEMSHNLYVFHGGTPTCDYCDYTCALGYCCRTRCPNAAHSWLLGWAAPRDDLVLSEMRVGQPYVVVLPPQQSTRNSVTRIQGANGLSYFLGYRTGDATYDVLNQDDSAATHIYQYLDLSARLTTADTWWLGRLTGTSPTYTHTDTGLIFRYVSSSPQGGSTVAICKADQLGAETNCSDGIDNDCDGYADGADSDCPAAGTAVAAGGGAAGAAPTGEATLPTKVDPMAEQAGVPPVQAEAVALGGTAAPAGGRAAQGAKRAPTAEEHVSASSTSSGSSSAGVTDVSAGGKSKRRARGRSSGSSSALKPSTSKGSKKDQQDGLGRRRLRAA